MSSPTELAGLVAPPINVPVFAPDGRRVHRFRQSSLKELDICTERARRTMTGTQPKEQSDAAAAGTAVHTGIELSIQSFLDDGEYLSPSTMNEAAQGHFTELMELPYFRWVDMREGGARKFIERACAAWYDEVRPSLRPRAVEVGFGPLVLHEDEHRIIEVTGTIDYLDEVGLADWKTSGREWEKWEHERWDVQPTTYTWAARQLGLIEEAEAWPFRFVIFVRGGTVKVQDITVWRHRGDHAWLKDRCLIIAKMIEAELPEWPRNDNHALCSEKWCPNWHTCKGAHYALGWPKPSAPRATPTVATPL